MTMKPLCAILSLEVMEKLLSVQSLEILDFCHDILHDQPSSICTTSSHLKESGEEGNGYVLTAFAYSDDKELIDSITQEVNQLFKKRLGERYPNLMRQVERPVSDGIWNSLHHWRSRALKAEEVCKSALSMLLQEEAHDESESAVIQELRAIVEQSETKL